MRAVVPCLALWLLSLSGCELVAKFDRSKIEPPAPVTPVFGDAGVIEPKPVEMDAAVSMDGGGAADAGRDAGLMDAGAGPGADAGPRDAGASDAGVRDAGSADAGAVSDAGAADAGAVPDAAAADASL